MTAINTKDSISSAINSNRCAQCRIAGYPICKCGSGAGASGPGRGDGSKSKKDAAAGASQAGISNQAPGEVNTAIQKFEEAKTIFVHSQLLSDKTINYETEFLSVVSDRLRGNLTLSIKPELSETDKKITGEFLKAVKKIFDKFKEKLGEQGRHFTATLTDTKLSINISVPKFYTDFINYLDRKNLLPVPNPERQVKNTEDNKQVSNPPKPFSTRLEKK